MNSPQLPRPPLRVAPCVPETDEGASAAPHVAAQGLFKSYRRGRHIIPVLQGVDLTIDSASFTAIVGKSGSGKSTLLHLLATLDAPDRGEIWYGSQRIDTWSARRQDRWRNAEVGMIFQFYHLLPELSALENVLVPRMIRDGLLGFRLRRGVYRRRAEELLDLVGLSHRLHHKPRELSGGEMQRTAIARALIADPALLLADEPTGNLDSDSGRDVLEILIKLQAQRGLTIVLVTHDDQIAALADRVVRLADGRIAPGVAGPASRLSSRLAGNAREL